MFRRKRQPDPLASRAAVRSILTAIREAASLSNCQSDRELVKVLRACLHAQRQPYLGTRQGRKPQFRRSRLAEIATEASAILARETNGRIGLASFAEHYARILLMPADVVRDLEAQRITLFEAEQLARVPDLAKRRELLTVHIKANRSTTNLRQRVQELLTGAGPAVLTALLPQVESALTEPEFDATHLFADELQRIGRALLEINSDSISPDLLDELLERADSLGLTLDKIKKQQAQPNRARRH